MEELKFRYPQLKTPRLLLKPLELKDAEDMYIYAKDPEVSKYLSWEPHGSVRDSETFIRFIQSKYEREEPAPWGIHLKGKLIGTCGFFQARPLHHWADLAYILGKEAWGQGYMTEALIAVVNFGFEELALNRIEAQCRVENTSSAQVMERAGLRFEGILRQRFYLRGEFHDSKMYGIVASDPRPSLEGFKD